jgi:hypothetical protein
MLTGWLREAKIWRNKKRLKLTQKKKKHRRRMCTFYSVHSWSLRPKRLQTVWIRSSVGTEVGKIFRVS